MISLNLSTVHENEAASARLAAATEKFLQSGGRITEKPGPIPVPRPYGYSAAVSARKAPSPVRSKKTTVQSLRITPDIEEAKAKLPKFESSSIDRVRELAKTMCQREVSAATGINRKRLYEMSLAYGFEFQPSASGGVANLVHNQSDLSQDAKNAERIKALLSVGISQRQAAKHMGISTCLLRRLIRDFDISVGAA